MVKKMKLLNEKLARYKDLEYLYDRYNDDDLEYKYSTAF